MSTKYEDIISELENRDLIAQLAGEDKLKEHIAADKRVVYCGFDPTAESLHIGSVVPLLVLRRFQLAGHKPIALVGGATGLIGDPSFKAVERQLNPLNVVEEWVERLKPQLSQFLDFDCGSNSAVLVNNLEWTQNLDLLGFLRDVGKHFSVNSMVQKDSVKQRIEREGEGISFTEFSYMLLQSLDFAELHKRFNCSIQVGGSDQWGNITGGIDLTRRIYQKQVFGVTTPLVTKADGTKFGKTEKGTIWISANKTSPYALYQFWLNVSDLDVYKYLRYFTFLSVEEIQDIELSDKSSQSKPEAQSILACEVTKLLHGVDGLIAAKRISDSLFSGDISKLTREDLKQLDLDGLPKTSFAQGNVDIIQALVRTELAKSNKMAREFISNNAISVNGSLVSSGDLMLDSSGALEGGYFVLRRGKKMFHLVKVE
ncbi:MAG: tyrosine--tRNA ligase [Gammaproteobacteria bacterium]|nr:tyrosine--tRNA ligase [Gammaproteobacteria bacterium]